MKFGALLMMGLSPDHAGVDRECVTANKALTNTASYHRLKKLPHGFCTAARPDGQLSRRSMGTGIGPVAVAATRILGCRAVIFVLALEEFWEFPS